MQNKAQVVRLSQFSQCNDTRSLNFWCVLFPVGGGGQAWFLSIHVYVTLTLTNSLALLDGPVFFATKLYRKCCFKRSQEKMFRKCNLQKKFLDPRMSCVLLKTIDSGNYYCTDYGIKFPLVHVWQNSNTYLRDLVKKQFRYLFDALFSSSLNVSRLSIIRIAHFPSRLSSHLFISTEQLEMTMKPACLLPSTQLLD